MSNRQKLLLLTAGLACALGVAAQVRSAPSKHADQAEAGPAKPSLPAIESLQLEPSSLTLADGRDSRQVLVRGITKDGQRFDLSDVATFAPDSANVALDSDHYLFGQAAGDATVTVTVADKQAKLPVKVVSAEVPKVRFVRDVMPVLAGVGCNAGTCHGSAKGKNGFKLSLRGYDPEFDYNALVNELQGRRVNRVQPDQSLMLLKPTGAVPHEGKQVIIPGSRRYNIIYQWIKEGVHNEPDAANARPSSLEVLPKEAYLDLPGRTQRVAVLAHYPDGAVRDVTRETYLSANNTEVAKVVGNTVTGLRRGESSILIRYEGNYGVLNVTVMGDRTGFVESPMPEYNYIDRYVNAKLAKVKIAPSDECTDAEFMRRVYLDLTGIIPTVQQARAFVDDKTPSRQKREALIDQLIGNKDFVDYWSNKWADLLQCSSKTLGEKSMWAFREWIREAVAQNKPYDQFVHELVTAQGSSLTNPAVNHFRSLKETGKITEDVSQTFLGTRFNCNKCHDHPFERWTQGQYYQFGAYFARVSFKKGTHEGEEIVYTNYNGGEVSDPKTLQSVAAKVPFGTQPDEKKFRIRQEAFADWMTSKDNPLFARSYANRVWSYFFGRGIIEPVDDIRASNPPVNPELLDALTEDFVHSGFDVRHLMRTIVSSRTYQLSLVPNKWNEDDKINFSHMIPRRLSAEQMVDAVAIATGTKPKVPGLPEGMRSVDAPDGMVAGDDFLKLFGRPKRESACECERTSNVSLAHALNLVNGPLISGNVDEANNAVGKLVAKEQDNRKVVEEIYYMVLSRPPTDAELAAIDLGAGPQRVEVAQDLAWALLNSPAFLFNR